MTQTIHLSLEVPPSANRYWRHFGRRVVLSEDAKNYKLRVRGAGLRAMLKEPLEGPVSVTIRWYRKAKQGDLDNRLKILMDSLQGVAFVSDAQVREIHAYKDDSEPKKPRCEVYISPLPDSAI